MFGGWSTEKSFHVHEPKVAIKRHGSVTRLVRFFLNKKGDLVPSPDTANPFGHIVSQVDKREHAVVKELKIKFLHNDFKDLDTMVYVDGMYANEIKDQNEDENNNNDEDCYAQDKRICIPCPPSFNDYIRESDEVIDKAEIDPDDLKSYAGMEEYLTKPTLAEINVETDDEGAEGLVAMFEPGHQFLYLREHMLNTGKLQISAKHDIKKRMYKGQEYYEASQALIDAIRTYANVQYFDKLHYTRFEQCLFSTNVRDQHDIQSGRGLTIVLQIDYLVVNV